MRISDQMMFQNVAQNIDNAQAAYVQSQQEAASGLSISQPSDNPSGTAVVLQIETTRQQVASWQQNAQWAQGQMQTTDTTMTNLENAITAARSLAVQAVSGATSQTDLQSMSQQASGILSEVQNLANTQYNGAYVFSGVSQAPPVAGGTYNSASASSPQQIEVGTGVQVPVSVDGNKLFNTAPTGQPVSATLLNVLSNLASDLQSGNTVGVEADLGALEAQSQNVNSMHAVLGADMDRIQAALQQLSATSQNLQVQQGKIENVDMAQILAQLSNQQMAYQAAVAAGSSLKLPTLANYLP